MLTILSLPKDARGFSRRGIKSPHAQISHLLLARLAGLADLMVIVPAEALFQTPSPITVIWFHLLALAFLLLSRRIWTSGLRRYSSASS